jgi:hypothetical protein
VRAGAADKETESQIQRRHRDEITERNAVPRIECDQDCAFDRHIFSAPHD